MDGESTNDVIMTAEDATAEFATIPLTLEFEEPETVNNIITVNNDEPVEMEPPEPQQEPITVLAVPAMSTVAAVRLVSGADDNVSTAVGDVEDENMDRRARRTRSRSRRSRRGRRSRSRSRRSRSRRSRSRRGRGRRSRSRSDDSDFSVQIADEDIYAEPAAGSSRGRQKTARGGRRARKVATSGRGGGKTTRDSGVSEKASRGTRSGRKPARGSRRGRKIAGSAPARTLWTDRLRPLGTYRNKKSKAK